MLTQPRSPRRPQAPAPETNHILESQIHHFPGLDQNNDETCGFNTLTPVHHHEQGTHGEKNNRRDNAVADEAVTLNRELQ